MCVYRLHMSFVAPHIVNRASHTQITSLQSSRRSYFRNCGRKWCRHDSDVGTATFKAG